MTDFEFNKPVPYVLNVDEQLLRVTKQKLALARYPDEQEDIGNDNWNDGSKVHVVRRLADYWRDGFDWRAQEVSMQIIERSAVLDRSADNGRPTGSHQ